MKRKKALEVAPAQLLVGAREPHQLAQVRVAALAVPAREHGEVVVVLGDDELAEPLERDARRRGDEPLEALLERADQALVRRVERVGQRPLEPRVERAPPRVRRSRKRASLETPTNGDASTATSASSS